MHRSHPGYDRLYENKTGRYSLRKVLVENGAEDVKFTIETAEVIDKADISGTFLQIYADTRVPGNGEYSYRINCSPDFDAGTTTVLAPSGTVTVPLSCTENALTVTVPKNILNGDTLYFKVCDSREEITCTEDFYDHGDVLPMGCADFCVILK